MSFKSWFQKLDSIGGVGPGGLGLGRQRRLPSSFSQLGREGGRQRRPRSAARFLEHLEARITLSATTLASFIAPAGLAPQAAVITDSNGNLYGTTEAGAPQATARFSSWPRAAARPSCWPRSTSPTVQDRMPR